MFNSFISDKRVRKINSGSNKSTSSMISTKTIENIVEKLKNERYRSTTRNTYHKIWHSFNKFFIWLDRKPNNWEDQLTLFVAFLIEENKLKSTTIQSYISAIKAVLAEIGVKLTDDFFALSLLTRACKLKNDCVLIRLPI